MAADRRESTRGEMLMRVVDPGFSTTLQDLGRSGWHHLGVSVGGAADPLAARLANHLVGNDPGTALLECTISGPTMVVHRDCIIAVTGAPIGIFVDEVQVAFGEPVFVSANQLLRIGRCTKGMRSYLAVQGGFAGDEFLGSYATHLGAASGGYFGRALQSDDLVHQQKCEQIVSIKSKKPNIDLSIYPDIGNVIILRATLGPEILDLSAKELRQAREIVFHSGFCVSPTSNRMGVRLIPLPNRPLPADTLSAGNFTAFQRSIISGAVYPGTVQMPSDGHPILLACDCQATGGYPRLLQVIDADLWQIGQLRPGATLWFREVSIDAARDINSGRRNLINQMLG